MPQEREKPGNEPDELTLREIIKDRRILFFECGKCMRLTKAELLELIHKVGPDVPLGQFSKRLICERCGARQAVALTCIFAGRAPRQWLPREPAGFRSR